MQQEMTQVRLDEMRGAPVYDSDGDKIGEVEEIYYDQQTRVPEWIGIGTGFFGTKRVLVPVQGAASHEDGLMVPYPKDHVKDSPDIDEDEISQQTEADLAAYYGVGYSEEQSQTGLTDGGRRATGKDGGQQSVTRSFATACFWTTGFSRWSGMSTSSSTNSCSPTGWSIRSRRTCATSR